MGLAMMWTLGWTLIAWLVGAVMDLKMSTSMLLGALLGPLGFLVVLLVGFAERKSALNGYVPSVNQSFVELDDPFR